MLTTPVGLHQIARIFIIIIIIIIIVSSSSSSSSSCSIVFTRLLSVIFNAENTNNSNQNDSPACRWPECGIKIRRKRAATSTLRLLRSTNSSNSQSQCYNGRPSIGQLGEVWGALSRWVVRGGEWL